MYQPPKPRCNNCGNQETVERKRSFLGFGKCVCSICESKFADPLVPLSKGYRIGYWVMAIGLTLAFLPKLPRFIGEVIGSVMYYPSALLTTLIEQWPFLLFITGAVIALRKDAVIRKRIRLEEKANASVQG